MKKHSLSMCIAIPTNNQYKRIEYWLKNKMQEIVEYNVDVIVFDNKGNSEETKRLIEGLHCENIHYDCYDEVPLYPSTIDEKVKFILKRTSNKYDVIWVCRDRSFPNLSEVYDLICYAYNSDNDFVVVNPHPIKNSRTKVYNDAAKLAEYEYGEMTSLGSIVFFKKIAQNIANNFPVIENVNLGLWLPTALFQCIANMKFKATKIYANSFSYIQYTEPSHWLKNRSAVVLYTQWLPNIIKNLPNKYDKVKNSILTFKYWSMPLWNTNLLIYLRSSGNFTVWDIIKHFNILLKQTKWNFFKLLIFSMIPKILMFYCLKKQINIALLFNNLIQNIFSIKNSGSKRHKVITFLGIKIKFHRTK